MKRLALGCASLLLPLVLSLSGGCTSARYSGRYGDGTTYTGIGGARTFRKFYLRKVEGDGIFVSSASISMRYPDLFRRNLEPGDIPVDVHVRKINADDGGGWSLVFAFLYSIIPSWTWNEQSYSLEISIDGDSTAVPSATCSYAHDFKMSVLSPFGMLPYGEKSGYQRNEFNSGLMEMSLDVSDVLEDVMAACIAQQVTRHALERLTIPDVDF